MAHWGEGLLASVDGLRFVVPKRTIKAGPSPKYYHYKRGITWLNAVNDQVAGIGRMAVPGTPRDSLHIVDTLLNLDAGVKPETVATGNASYSDIVFGLFSMLGYNFPPLQGPGRPAVLARGDARHRDRRLRAAGSPRAQPRRVSGAGSTKGAGYECAPAAVLTLDVVRGQVGLWPRS